MRCHPLHFGCALALRDRTKWCWRRGMCAVRTRTPCSETPHPTGCSRLDTAEVQWTPTEPTLNDIPRGATPSGQGQGVRFPRRGVRLSPLGRHAVPAEAVLREVLAQPVGIVDDAA